MKKSLQLVISAALMSAFAFALHAQTPEAAQASQTSGKVTLTGCVERADQMSGTGTATTTVDSLSFVLIHATTGAAADAPKGTAGTTSSASKGTMYRLAGDVSKLNLHVGHKVEVTGTLDGPPANPSAPSGETQSLASAPKLTVLNLKMLAETCAR